jgi:two-component sensor histidine kinase
VPDNGVGRPEGFDPREDRGLGFQLVRSRAQQLSASLVFDSDALGLRFKIILPRQTANHRKF